MPTEVATLTLNVTPEALKTIIADGRLLEFTQKVASEAAAQISAQLVDHVASAALKQDGLKSGSGAQVTYIIDGGDFGTRPPRPHWGVTSLDQGFATALRKVAAAGEIEG